LVVTDNYLFRNGYADELIEQLKKLGLDSPAFVNGPGRSGASRLGVITEVDALGARNHGFHLWRLYSGDRTLFTRLVRFAKRTEVGFLKHPAEH
jgi:hypothetical protein